MGLQGIDHVLFLFRYDGNTREGTFFVGLQGIDHVLFLFRYDGNTREGTFSVGLQGIHEEDEEKVRNIISQTLDHVIE